MNAPVEPKHHRITVDDNSGQGRLDVFLAERLAGLSRSRIAQLIAEGKVRVNNAPARKSQIPESGDIIDVDIPAPASSDVKPEAIELSIVYQDEDLLVLDKPAGIVVHPAPGHRSGTLVNALLHHVRDLSGIGGVMRPGIVHRLDKDTSGLLLVAKNDTAHRALSDALKRREIRRTYRAAVWGHLAEERTVIDAPIARSHTDRQKMGIAREGEGRSAVTRAVRLERWVGADYLRVHLQTGRTHQIRVHLASIGHPVVGDRAYGSGAERGMSGKILAWSREFARMVPRQFLHAAELRFVHPRTAEEMRFLSELPLDLAGAAEWARSSSTT